jgi:hypothetical protein
MSVLKSLLAPLLSVFALALLFTGCEKPAPPPADQVLFQAIQDNAQAFDKKDVDAVMATIHPQAPNLAQTREFIAQLFNDMDLKFTVSDLKVVTATPEEARVSFKQKTEKVEAGSTVPLNVIEGVHTLRPDNGKWTIFNTIKTKETRLDQKPADSPENSPSAPAPGAPASPAAPAPASVPAPATAEPTAPAAPTPAAATPAPKPEAPAEKPAQ